MKSDDAAELEQALALGVHVFAAFALAGVLAGESTDAGASSDAVDTHPAYAAKCYGLADAMVAEARKRLGASTRDEKARHVLGQLLPFVRLGALTPAEADKAARVLAFIRDNELVDA